MLKYSNYLQNPKVVNAAKKLCTANKSSGKAAEKQRIRCFHCSTAVSLLFLASDQCRQFMNVISISDEM